MIVEKIQFRFNRWKTRRRLLRDVADWTRKVETYHKKGNIPWSEGYGEYKEDFITYALHAKEVNVAFENRDLPSTYGKGLDERCVEYPWLKYKIDKLLKTFHTLEKQSFLDAGSTFNFEYIVDAFDLTKFDATIYTFHPEKNCYWNKRISYVFGDLRALPFKDGLFSLIVCQSTLEHVDMDNSMYGYELKSMGAQQEKSFDYKKVIHELVRVLKPGGTLLITFPFGRYERHGFFQQFDAQMVNDMKHWLQTNGDVTVDYVRYINEGWKFSSQEECADCFSYNPHTGVGKGNDGAAHSRAIACIEFKKST